MSKKTKTRKASKIELYDAYLRHKLSLEQEMQLIELLESDEAGEFIGYIIETGLCIKAARALREI